jgi:RNA polymerase sigma factor (sigma-70 family)
VTPSTPPWPRPEEPPDTFQGLIEKARAGNAGACQLLYDRYHEVVLQVVRRHLHRRLRSILDSIDVTQIVWKSIFGCIQDGQPFAGPREFLAFLTGLARNKTLQEHRQAMEVEKRSLAHEEPLAEHAREVHARPDPAGSPADRAAVEDEWALFLRRLPNRDREALEALRAGEPLEAVAQRRGVTMPTLRRLMHFHLAAHFGFAFKG